jgi:hypothetical protein
MICIKIHRSPKSHRIVVMLSILSLVARRVTGKPEIEKQQVVAELQ